jgi:biopolymer transport protein ExbB
MIRYHHKYRVVLAALIVVSLVLPAPLFAQMAPAASPSTTTPQTTPETSYRTPHIQPPAASTEIALKLPRDLSPWGMFMAADIVVKSVMVGLVFASVLTWTIWFAKAIELMIARRRMRAAIEALNQASSWGEVIECVKGRDNRPAALLRAAEVELRLSADAMSSTGLKERIASRLERIEAAAGRHMIRGTGILASIGATAPFIGLFGTVWGIMNSFIGISKSHTTNLAVVAPGIAEALLATALGLVAAIPAVVMYNVFSRWIAEYRALHADAAAEILRLISRDLDRGAFDQRPVERRRAMAAE